MYVCLSTAWRNKTLLVTPKKSFEKNVCKKNRQAPGELERDRAYYVSKQGRTIMQRSLVLLLELGRQVCRQASERASERAKAMKNKREYNFRYILFVQTRSWS